MLIRTLDGKRTIEINAVDSRLKMACVAELAGDENLAWCHLQAALEAERVVRNEQL